MIPEQKFVFTRRDFLKTTAIAGLSVTLPSFLTRSVEAAMPYAGAIPGFKDDRILVVIQLGGGNDGINTVVPFGDDAYYSARKNLAIKKADVLGLDDYSGLNPKLKELKELYDGGGLAVVNGVGYPNPDRSHFRSMEIWHTAVDSNRFSESGWIGRYFDNCCSGKPEPVAGVNVGSEFPQSFAGRRGTGVSFQEPQQFRWIDGNEGKSRATFDALNRTAAKHADEGNTLDFLRHTTANAVVSSDKVIKAGSTNRKAVTYPGGKLGPQLKTIATLIAGGLPTRIYYTSLTGFDTHANQLNQQDNLLGQFSGAVAAFMKDLKAIGVADRVMVFAFSEFGRRVEENASRGTDHGTAGPMFLAGAGIKAGLHGKYPSLTDLDDGDLKHTVDFRSVYGEVLGSWFGVEQTKVLGREFPGIGIVKA
jgi:uncharacterized protein (DUF1501 family)